MAIDLDYIQHLAENHEGVDVEFKGKRRRRIIPYRLKYNQILIRIGEFDVTGLDFNRRLETAQSLADHAGGLVANFLTDDFTGILYAEDHNRSTVVSNIGGKRKSTQTSHSR